MSRGSNYRFSYISRIATNYIRPNYAIGSFNHEYFWYGNIPLIGYFGEKDDLHTVTLKVLNNNHDYASAKINCVQNKNTILGHVIFVTNRGNKHLSIDTTDGLMITNDFRIRLCIDGNTAAIKYTKKKDILTVSYNQIRIIFSVPYMKFDNTPIKFVVSKSKSGIYFDLCLIKSTKPVTLDFRKMNEAICQFILKLCDDSTAINTSENEKDSCSLISSLKCDYQDSKLQSLYKPDHPKENTNSLYQTSHENPY